MTTVKRLLTTLGVGLTIVLVTGVPALATFADSAALASMTISTATVAAPTQVEAKLLCTTTVDPTTGTSTTTRTLKIEWWRSTSPGVTGYAVTAYPRGGPPYQLVVTGPTDEAYVSADEELISSDPRFTVTTLTSYGWTATSPKVGMSGC
jgi:hypothetical protein